MRISDWSSDVCSSDLKLGVRGSLAIDPAPGTPFDLSVTWWRNKSDTVAGQGIGFTPATNPATGTSNSRFFNTPGLADYIANNFRSKEHTSELQSLMRISYAVFCLKKKKKNKIPKTQ